MKNKRKKLPFDFKKNTPKMQINRLLFSGIYKKSLLESNEKTESDFSKNTTTWD